MSSSWEERPSFILNSLQAAASWFPLPVVSATLTLHPVRSEIWGLGCVVWEMGPVSVSFQMEERDIRGQVGHKSELEVLGVALSHCLQHVTSENNS